MKTLFLFLALCFAGVVSASESGEVKLFYDANGQLYSGKYITYHENGQVNSDFTISNGMIVGMAKFFYESGEVQETGNYVNGLKDGAWIRYSKTGVKIS